MFTADFIGILLALTAATVWGSADFSGGLATRRHNQYLVLLLSALSGLVLLVIAALVWREAFLIGRTCFGPYWQGWQGCWGYLLFIKVFPSENQLWWRPPRR
jgi:hypothetical protein